MEMAMLRPERVDAIACLCPAAAFSYRPGLTFAKVLRPELGVAVAGLPRSYVKKQIKQLFSSASRLHDTWFDAAIDDFLNVWRNPRARIAFFASLRNIYLDEPYSETGFWTRLAKMDTPTLYIYGRRDVLITSRFAKKVADVLPAAKVLTWKDCGHVPQLEHPRRTEKAMLDFYRSARKLREPRKAG